MRLAILCFVAGVILLQQQAQLLPAHGTLTGAALLFLAAVLVWWRFSARSAYILMLLSAFATGFAWANALATIRMAQRLPHALEGHDVAVVGVVDQLPRRDERALKFTLLVEQSSESLGGTSRLAVNWYAGRDGAAPPALQAGERWRLTVRLKRPRGTVNPNAFDFERFALEQNIGATGYVRERVTPQRLTEFVPRLGYVIERWRGAIQARFAQALSGKPYAGVMAALAIGEQSAIAPNHWLIFWGSGIGHLISISGLHVTMVAALAGALAGALWRRSARMMLWLPAQRVAILAGTLAALFYGALAGFSVPTQRTVYMLAVIAMAWWLGWTSSASRVLALALFAVVLIDPWAVGAPGFWLSFAAVAAIFYVSTGRSGQTHWFMSALRTQVAVTLLLAPLLLLLFSQLPLVSPLANALAIPVVSLLVVPLVLLGAVIPVDAILHLAHEIFALCIGVIEGLTLLPNAVWTRASPPLWSVVLALGGVFWLLLPRGFPARWLGALWLMPLMFAPASRPAQGSAWVSVLDVGQGLAVVVETAQRVLVYDTGPRYSAQASAGERIVLPFLRGRGLAHIDALIVSHADDDHRGGAPEVIAQAHPAWVLASLPADDDVMRRAQQAFRCSAGQHWEWDGVRFSVLNPPADANFSTQRENALSCVLKIETAHGSVLLTGDIEAAQEAALVAADPERLRSDVLIAAHHGSKTSNTQAFLDAVAAKTVVFTVGHRNRFQHPHFSVLARVRGTSAAILRSDAHGAIGIRFEPAAPPPSRLRVDAPKYWREQTAVTGE